MSREDLLGFQFGFLFEFSILTALINSASCYVFGVTKCSILLMCICFIGFIIGIVDVELYSTLYLKKSAELTFADTKQSIRIVYTVFLSIMAVLLGFYGICRCYPMLTKRSKQLVIFWQPIMLAGMVINSMLDYSVVGIFIFLLSFIPGYCFNIYCFYSLIKTVRSNPMFKQSIKQRRILTVSNALLAQVFLLPIILCIVTFNASTSWSFGIIIGLGVIFISFSDILFAINKATKEKEIVWMGNTV